MTAAEPDLGSPTTTPARTSHARARQGIAGHRRGARARAAQSGVRASPPPRSCCAIASPTIRSSRRTSDASCARPSDSTRSSPRCSSTAGPTPVQPRARRSRRRLGRVLADASRRAREQGAPRPSHARRAVRHVRRRCRAARRRRSRTRSPTRSTPRRKAAISTILSSADRRRRLAVVPAQRRIARRTRDARARLRAARQHDKPGHAGHRSRHRRIRVALPITADAISLDERAGSAATTLTFKLPASHG